MRRPSRFSKTTRTRRNARLGESLEPRVLLSIHSLIEDFRELPGPDFYYRDELSVEADSELGDDPHANEVGDDATVLELTDGTVSVGSFIDTAGDVDVFTVTPSVTGRLSTKVEWTDLTEDMPTERTGRFGRWLNWLNPGTDVGVSVVNSAGEELSSGRGGVSVRAGESYSIIVSASDETSIAQYAMNLRVREGFDFEVPTDSAAGEDPHGAEFDESATPLEFMENNRAVLSSIIDTADDVDVFRFTAETTGEIGIRIQRQASESDGLWDRIKAMRGNVSVNLYDSAGELITPMNYRMHGVNVDVGETYYLAISNRHEFSDPVEYKVGVLHRPAAIQPDSSKGDDQHADEAGVDSTALTLTDGFVEFSSYLDTVEDVDTFRLTPADDGLLNISGSLAGFGQAMSITVSTADGTVLDADRERFMIGCPVDMHHSLFGAFGADVSVEVVANTEYFITVASPDQNDGAYTISVELDSTAGDDEEDPNTDDNADGADDDVESDTDDQTQDDDTTDDGTVEDDTDGSDDGNDDNTTEDDTTADGTTEDDTSEDGTSEDGTDTPTDDGDGSLNSDSSDDDTAASESATRLAMDINNDGEFSIFEDVMLAARYMAGFRGDALINGIMDGETDAEDVAAHLDGLGDYLDADQDGEISVMEDGILMFRAGAGFSSSALFAGLGDRYEQGTEIQAVSQRLDDLMTMVTPEIDRIADVIWQANDEDIDDVFSNIAQWVLK